ncbi:MAG TPA: transglycosylase SLT domain-containing protein [Holophaga sp.]|nr:transglycosylase SLT domain-containing protein [Holophaga sp.]
MTMRPALLPFLLLPLAASAAGRTGKTYLYTYTDVNGNTIINNMPPAFVKGQGLTLKRVGVGQITLAISTTQMARVLKSPELLEMVDTIATQEGVDPYLARAVIQAESAFYTRARSRAGALGLMQLMPGTAERFGVLDPFDPRQNITGGVKFLRFLMNTFQGDLEKVVAAYNSGEGNVIKYKGIPPFAETRAYVPKVLNLYRNRLVQADPRAAGSMDLLKNGRGGFQVQAKELPPAGPKAAEPVRGNTRIYQWVDAAGRTQISDQPPPKGAQDVRVTP